jgi:hypothetical protein
VTDIGYGLRANHPLEQVAGNNGYPGADGKPKGNPMAATPISFEDFKQFVSPYTLDYTTRSRACPRTSCSKRWPGVRRPQDQGHVVLDHGLQPAHARHLGQQHDLQRPPAGGQDQ